MTLTQNVAEILKQHVTLEVEGIDRMCLNVYVPRLQIVEGVLAKGCCKTPFCGRACLGVLEPCWGSEGTPCFGLSVWPAALKSTSVSRTLPGGPRLSKQIGPTSRSVKSTR
jgi:hypothetical protein